MKKVKLSNFDLILIVISIFFAFIAIFALFSLKQNKTSVQSINEFNNRIASRYTEIVKGDENDILVFLQENISNDFVVMPAMDYVFKTCYPKFSNSGKAALYNFYYDSAFRFITFYQDLLDVEENRYYLQNFISEQEGNIEINNSNIYEKIDLTSLRVLIEEIRSNHLVIYQNGEYFEVFFDFDWFISEYSEILTDDLKDFLIIEQLSTNPEVSPNRESLDITIIEDMITMCVDYIKNHDDETLNMYCLTMLRNALQLYLCAETSYALYDDLTNFTISAEMLNIYSKYAEINKGSALGDLIEAESKIIKDNEGKGYPLDSLTRPLIDEYLIDNGFGTEEQINAISQEYDSQVDTDGLILDDSEDTTVTSEDILNNLKND